MSFMHLFKLCTIIIVCSMLIRLWKFALYIQKLHSTWLQIFFFAILLIFYHLVFICILWCGIFSGPFTFYVEQNKYGEKKRKKKHKIIAIKNRKILEKCCGGADIRIQSERLAVCIPSIALVFRVFFFLYFLLLYPRFFSWIILDKSNKKCNLFSVWSNNFCN